MKTPLKKGDVEVATDLYYVNVVEVGDRDPGRLGSASGRNERS